MSTKRTVPSNIDIIKILSLVSIGVGQLIILVEYILFKFLNSFSHHILATYLEFVVFICVNLLSACM